MEQELYPDHLGCLTAFIAALQQERIKALQENNPSLDGQLYELEKEMVCVNILPLRSEIEGLAASKIQHPFIREFLSYYFDVMLEDENMGTVLLEDNRKFCMKKSTMNGFNLFFELFCVFISPHNAKFLIAVEE